MIIPFLPAGAARACSSTGRVIPQEHIALSPALAARGVAPEAWGARLAAPNAVQRSGVAACLQALT